MTAIEFDEAKWKKAFESLPKDRQAMLGQWFAIQLAIMQTLGIPEDLWYGLIGWALEHPNDFSFMQAFPAAGRPNADAREAATGIEDVARALLATEKHKAPVASGPGVKAKATATGLDKELFQRFMNARTPGPAPKAKPKKK